ncbi:MAG: ATP-binding cassette domain-containing protein, partial [Candidatus Gastranaerophilales bacterium]|nr:ATP-binding cassette domain-containing protein [Candidatus Gastranaerophilales bacterium]
SIFRKLNVEDNLKLVLEMNDKLSQDEKDELLENLLTEFGVQKLRHASAVALSGGERRRVEIARALAATPSFILLDEPFTGIDPIAIGEIKENIYKLAKEKNIGILITDHNPKATLSITDRANVIFDGKIKISGKSSDVAVDPVAKKFYLGEDFVL